MREFSLLLLFCIVGYFQIFFLKKQDPSILNQALEIVRSELKIEFFILFFRIRTHSFHGPENPFLKER